MSGLKTFAFANGAADIGGIGLGGNRRNGRRCLCRCLRGGEPRFEGGNALAKLFLQLIDPLRSALASGCDWAAALRGSNSSPAAAAARHTEGIALILISQCTCACLRPRANRPGYTGGVISLIGKRGVDQTSGGAREEEREGMLFGQSCRVRWRESILNRLRREPLRRIRGRRCRAREASDRTRSVLARGAVPGLAKRAS